MLTCHLPSFKNRPIVKYISRPQSPGKTDMLRCPPPPLGGGEGETEATPILRFGYLLSLFRSSASFRKGEKLDTVTIRYRHQSHDH